MTYSSKFPWDEGLYDTGDVLSETNYGTALGPHKLKLQEIAGWDSRPTYGDDWERFKVIRPKFVCACGGFEQTTSAKQNYDSVRINYLEHVLESMCDG